MDVESRQGSKGDAMAAAAAVSVDWRGRPCDPSKHGGMKAAVFVLGIQAFEMMAIAAVGNNLITYVFGEMHFPLSQAANIVTNFIGTVFLLSLLGGFLSDSYLGSFWTMLIFGFVELSGFILLAVQAHLPQLRPPPCDMMMAAAGACEQAGGMKAGIFFAALYLVALGSGCLKPNIIAHGADQFRRSGSGGGGGGDARRLSSYFNAAYFSFCVGEMVALTVLVWVQTRSGMDVGFGVSAAAMAIGLLSLVAGAAFYRNKPPQGSIFTPIAKVFVAAVSKRKQVCPSTASVQSISHINKFRFLDKACVKAPDGPGVSSSATGKESPWRLCTPAEVEQVKLLLCVVPIFACTIVFNTILAQLQTFSVQQGSAMDTRLAAGFHVPPASLQAIPYAMLVALVPAYEAAFVPAMRRLTGDTTGITPLQRIGVGLFAVTFSMVAAALVEARRRHAAADAGGGGRLLSIFWIAPQFLVFGLSEMFTAVGLIEFFYKQSLSGMQAFLTSMAYCSYSFGFYLSSVLVSLVNRVTSSSTEDGNGGWLANNDLNKDRLDLFYWLLAALSILNFFNYLFWARWYSNSVQTVQVVGVGSAGKLIAVELLSTRRVKASSYARHEQVEKLISTLRRGEGKPVALDEHILSLTDGIIGTVAFGNIYANDKFSQYKNFQHALDDATEILSGSGSSGEDLFPKAIGRLIDRLNGFNARRERIFKELDAFFEMVIEQHMDPKRSVPENGGDLVDVLIDHWKNPRDTSFSFTRDHVKAILFTMTVASTDTTAATILWAMSELIRNPCILKKVQDEVRAVVGRDNKVQEDDLPKLGYLKMVIKETLRLHAPTPVVPRETTRHIQIAGYDVPAKTRIYVNAWAVNTDPASWPDHPEEFNPDRFQTINIDFKGDHAALIPFGLGRRICPGIPMSMATAEFTLANLLFGFQWALPEGMTGDDVSMEEEGKLLVHRKTPLVLVPTVYRHGLE